MPHMNGDEFARRLRATAAGPAGAVSHRIQRQAVCRSLQLWEDEAFLDKPCSVNGLLEAVCLVIHRPVAGGLCGLM